MSTTMLHYKGTVRWNDAEYKDPIVYYCENLLPYGKDLVILCQDDEMVIAPFSNQEEVKGVVTLVKQVINSE